MSAVFITAGYDIKLEVYAVLCRLNPSTKPGLSLGFLYEKEGGSGLGTEGSFHHTMESIAGVFTCITISIPTLFFSKLLV